MYQTACTECMVEDKSVAIYVGETARSGCERMTEHLNDAKQKQGDSHILKHWINHHGGRETKFSFEIIRFFKTPLERQIGEAVRIEKTGANQILNSKSMFNRNGLTRIMVKDVPEEVNLGDRVDMEQQEDDVTDQTPLYLVLVYLKIYEYTCQIGHATLALSV